MSETLNETVYFDENCIIRTLLLYVRVLPLASDSRDYELLMGIKRLLAEWVKDVIN